MQLLIISGIALALCGVVFAFQNNVPVTVTFLFLRFDSWLALVILVAALLGAMVIALVSLPSAIRVRWQLRRQQKTIDQQQMRIAELERQVGMAEAKALSARSAEVVPPATFHRSNPLAVRSPGERSA
jgi:uncharacterized integral membrane protein